jgi:lincosamide nucleotidyltransferase A/C/D/E
MDRRKCSTASPKLEESSHAPSTSALLHTGPDQPSDLTDPLPGAGSAGHGAVMVLGRYRARVTRPQQPPSTGKGRQPAAAMDSVDAVAVLDALRSRGISAWVHGGWGVDALGEQTRDHDDLDLVVQVEDGPRIAAALSGLGYRVAKGAPPTNLMLLDQVGHQIDLHPVRFAPNRDGIDRMETGEDWPFPAAGFAGHGRIGGRQVRCLTPEVEALTHEGYELDAEDQQDLEALRRSFGVEVPRP